MQLPHKETLAPGPIAQTVAEIQPDATVVALDGRAVDIAELASREHLRTLWLSRLSLQAALAVGAAGSVTRLVVHDYRAADLQPLSSLENLESLIVVGSSRLKSLSGLEALATLRELVLFDNCNYSSLVPLGALINLSTLCLEGGFSKVLRVDSLRPLCALTALERLRLASIRVTDGGLRPLHGLTKLREVFVASTFGETELRSLAAALPEARGDFLDQWRRNA